MTCKHQKKNKNNLNYLKKYTIWNKYIAEKLAHKEHITMDSRHWEIIYIVRMFYQEFNITPSMRMLLSYMKKKISQEKINSRYLFTLFSHNTLNKISKIAGIPPPSSCL